MSGLLKSEATIRAYLLGKVSDEATLEQIEELMFMNDEFCSQVEIAEDGLINDYVRGHLNQSDAESFRATLAVDPERRLQVELTAALREKALSMDTRTAETGSSLLASLRSFFRQPIYAGAFALLLIVAVFLGVYLTRRNNSNTLAQLHSIYRTSRPTETRISEFDYAPLSQLRGPPEAAEQKRLRLIENRLLEAAENAPTAENLHALGIYHLTQQKYPEAIKEFAGALKLAPQNAKVHSDLGVAYFELSNSEPKEKRLEDLSHSLEEFAKATELDGNLLEALFNKSLALQQFGLAREAKESWTLYLQKDPSSPWADEARKNLARIQTERALFKPDDRVLSDFLAACREHDEARVRQIHDETKGLLKGPTLPLQLSRRYVLAKQGGREAEARESLEAMTWLGNLDQTQYADAFFRELANFYAHIGMDQNERLLRAKDILDAGHQAISNKDYAGAIQLFEKSRDLFAQLGDTCEAVVAENWAVQFLPDVGKIAESRTRFAAMIRDAENKNFQVLLPPAHYYLGMSDYSQNRFSESAKNLKAALRLAESTHNVFEIQHAQDGLAFNYDKLGEMEPALLYAGKALPYESLYYQNPTQWRRANGTLADLALKLNLYSTSFCVAKEALDAAEENSPNQIALNDSLRHIVRAAAAKNDFPAALNYANRAMEAALARTDDAQNIRTKAELYRLVGDIDSEKKDCSEAVINYDQALRFYEQLPEVTFSAYQIHKGRLLCYRDLNQRAQFASELKTVLDLSEEYRRTIREDSSRQAFFENEQSVFDAAADEAISEHNDQSAFALVEASKARSLLESLASQKSIDEVGNDFASVRTPLSLREVQARLPDQVQVVEYAVLPQRLAIWTLSKTRFDFTEKAITAADLENKIEAYQSLILSKSPPSDLKRVLQDLYELLIPPGLAADKQLCLLPDKCLHQLAFATLVSPSGRYLLEDYALFSAPSASVLVVATENAQNKQQSNLETVLSIGNPDFDRDENPGLPDLKAAETEARVIAKSYRHSIELTGSEATTDRFLQKFVDPEVIHFAGHFIANRRSPGNSKLLFAGGELRASQLGAYRLPHARLVVLSACETGFERYNKSEGAIGIARAFLALGAPLVVASQWKVDSEATSELMIAFHQNRTAKAMSTVESLRQAQLEMIKTEKTSSPFYWGAFSLFGGYATY
jgi:CHAT domain-containing protein